MYVCNVCNVRTLYCVCMHVMHMSVYVGMPFMYVTYVCVRGVYCMYECGNVCMVCVYVSCVCMFGL